ncbi:PadR family transcriptional regulator [Thermosipho affectus]|uniref:PadR family transcriptional regulator n=1 Tax=Thermosipho affectus TaxID=660294 RepID=A0ABX3IJ82_9BACT|nr:MULTISPECIES: PadR family transcriptional regulator [unclassified Thermosipho (in: thermotogales)]ANQ54127.1 PadR family transcriptional regulator [Thermosipho sp. 1070]APT72572.1 PadR family transcriptional regulator [Thermosipho sp. 1063]ONN26577.1 PadR family transcriptional regulator [Thermosipho affectus]OOC41973.1 PadR family transcriptional regulator [Thermosipho sp. 1074]
MPRRLGRRGRGFVLGDFLTASLLLLLKEKPSHGYELVQRLFESKFYNFRHDPGVIYNILRKLEINGFITYDLEEGDGPFRKVYKITKEGEKYLMLIKSEIESLSEQLENFLDEFYKMEES